VTFTVASDRARSRDRVHDQYEAVRVFGREHMVRFSVT
jgi:hypothetical protein